MEKVIITRGERGFKVETDSAHIAWMFSNHHEALTQPKLDTGRGKYNNPDKEKPQGDQYSVHADDGVYYFMNGQMEAIRNIIDQTMMNLGIKIDIIYNKFEPPVGKEVTFDNYNFNIWEEDEDSKFYFQNGVVETITGPSPRHDILEIQTGRGKSLMAMKAFVLNSKRVLMITKPSYVEKWVPDLTKSTERGLGLKDGELLVCGGVKAVDDLLEAGRQGTLNSKPETKVILISSRTLDMWIKECIEDGEMELVENFLTYIETDYVVYDETHEWFRNNYWTTMLLNPPRLLDMTATIIPEDQFMRNRYAERLPNECRYNDVDYIRYIKAISVYYTMLNKKDIKRINSMKFYNHTEFEKVIMRRGKKCKEAYYNMVYELLNMFYFRKYQKGQRALIFFASQKMCTEFVDYVKERRPNFNVKRNIQGDSLEEFLEADIGVSTPGKSGTAIDIPGLVLSIMTVALNKGDKNLQVLGRTREVKDWDVEPRVIYIHAHQVAKHVKYLIRREKLFRGKVKSFDILSSHFTV